MQRSNDTIALIATPLGEGGIGVVQVSGPQALEMASKLFMSKRATSASGGLLPEIDLTKAPSGSLFYGTIHDSKGLIDEVLVSIWRANGGPTGEGLVEINCHGGIMAVRKTLYAFLKMGAREGSWEELLDRAVPSVCRGGGGVFLGRWCSFWGGGVINPPPPTLFKKRPCSFFHRPGLDWPLRCSCRSISPPLVDSPTRSGSWRKKSRDLKGR